MSKRDLPQKVCVSCGRRFAWRKKWRNNWDEVNYCSARCRSRGTSQIDDELERAILSLLSERAAGATICPSEAARKVWLHDSQPDVNTGDDGWRELMEPTRRAARRLVEGGQLHILQKGRIVDPSTAKGPIRLRLVQGQS